MVVLRKSTPCCRFTGAFISEETRAGNSSSRDVVTTGLIQANRDTCDSIINHKHVLFENVRYETTVPEDQTRSAARGPPPKKQTSEGDDRVSGNMTGLSYPSDAVSGLYWQMQWSR